MVVIFKKTVKQKENETRSSLKKTGVDRRAGKNLKDGGR